MTHYRAALTLLKNNVRLCVAKQHGGECYHFEDRIGGRVCPVSLVDTQS